MKKWIILLMIVVIAALPLVGCGSIGLLSSTGTLTVLVTDAPSYTVNSVVVHFSEVWVHKAGEGEDDEGQWIQLTITGGMLSEGFFDLALLRDEGETQELVSANLTAGEYTQLRVVMDEDLGVQVDYDENEGDPVNAKLPSGTLKFVRLFTVEENGSTEIILDFNLEKSVIFEGNFNKEPNPQKPDTDKPSIIIKPVVKLQVTSTAEDTDVTAPAIPTGLTAIPGDTQVSLDWDDNAETDLKEYIVYRANTSGGPYEEIIRITDSVYTDIGVTNGTTYYYVVTAVDESDNESGYSTEVSAMPAL